MDVSPSFKLSLRTLCCITQVISLAMAMIDFPISTSCLPNSWLFFLRVQEDGMVMLATPAAFYLSPIGKFVGTIGVLVYSPFPVIK